MYMANLSAVAEMSEYWVSSASGTGRWKCGCRQFTTSDTKWPHWLCDPETFTEPVYTETYSSGPWREQLVRQKASWLRMRVCFQRAFCPRIKELKVIFSFVDTIRPANVLMKQLSSEVWHGNEQQTFVAFRGREMTNMLKWLFYGLVQ